MVEEGKCLISIENVQKMIKELLKYQRSTIGEAKNISTNF